MFIQTEQTPNPATLKFLPGQDVLKSGTADFKSVIDAVKSPLAKRLFGLQGVAGVFLAKEFISVTKADDTDWVMLKPMIMATIMEHLSTGQEIVFDNFYEDQSEHSSTGDDCEIVQQIKELLDTRVRPAVAMDGGDIVFESFDDGIVFLRMQGACAGCPSSTMTLKSGIENMLKHFVPEVIEVRQVDYY